MRNYLLNDVLPFWLDHAIDEEHGGIFTCLDREGNIYGTDKSVWFQGRALYIFSVTYNRIEKDEKYLKAAKTIFDFLPKCGDETGRMAFSVTREGVELQKRRYYFSETFAAIGCAEYYFATGDEEAKRRAEMYFDVAYDIFSGKVKTAPKFNPEAAPYKALSPAMIMLSTAQVLRRLNPEKYNAIAKNAVEEIKTHWTDKGLLENISVDNQFVDTPTGRTVNPGHSLECAWFLMAEGIYQNDESLKALGREIIDVSMKLGLRDGGIIAFTDCCGKPATALEWDMKLWWPQNEAIIANRLCYEIYGDEKYLKDYESLLKYAFEKFADREYGEWYGYLHYDNTPSHTLKGNIFKGPFHLPRMLILLDLMDRKENLIQ